MYLHSFGECVLGNFIVWPEALQNGYRLRCLLFFFFCVCFYIKTYHMQDYIYIFEHFGFKIVGDFVVEFICTRARNYTSRSGVTHCIQLEKRQPIQHEMHEHVSHKFECDPERLFMIHMRFHKIMHTSLSLCVCFSVCAICKPFSNGIMYGLNIFWITSDSVIIYTSTQMHFYFYQLIAFKKRMLNLPKNQSTKTLEISFIFCSF